jgi:NADPH:quinone reductase-like Zn-dependent oxidoreductase
MSRQQLLPTRPCPPGLPSPPRAKFVTGESVLILGATGVAGQLAVQIAKRFGARRVIAAGRNPEALEKLKSLGADEVISLEQEPEPLVSAFRTEYTGAGVDIVLDYLWGKPAEAAFAAISHKGLDRAASRIRFIQIGSSAGKDISLSAATLRSSGLELLGSGFGSASFDQIRQAIMEFFLEAAKAPFLFHTQTAPLRAAEALWNQAEQSARLVFQP